MDAIPTRMGDGSFARMTRDEIKRDLGGRHRPGGAQRAKVPPLAQDELDHLLEIYASRARFTGVDLVTRWF